MIELSAESIADLNEDAVALTGENFAVLDPGGLAAAAARPWSGFGEVELFPTIFDKAGALLHAIASRQVFENGNKRTAWLAAVTLMELNGIEIGAVQTIQADAFVRAVSVDHNFAEGGAAEWFRIAHRDCRVGYASDPRLEYLILAGWAEGSDAQTLAMSDGHVRGLSSSSLPAPASVTVVSRIHWHADELGPHAFHVSIAPGPRVAQILTQPRAVELLLNALPSSSRDHRGAIPSIAVLGIPLSIITFGDFAFLVEVDGVEVGRIPMTISHNPFA